MRVLVTGGSGFLARHLVAHLVSTNDYNVRVATRHNLSEESDPSVEMILSPDLEGSADWSDALECVDAVIHTAGRAHVLSEVPGHESLEKFRKINAYGTLTLARQAASAGVRRFIFVSSIGVNGNINSRPFTEEDEPNPVDLYAQSKWEAEIGLWKIHEETGLETVIIRPPIVYGPNAPGNFAALVRWVAKGVPLPLGAIDNQRSLMGVDNLVDLFTTCIGHPAAANQVFLAGDGENFSTSELLRRVADAMGKPPRLIPVPAGLLQIVANLLGKKAMAQRLLGSLQVDISKARDVLGWTPPVSVDEGLRRCFETRRK
jgi:nucleoside-diphosphate-sugar epimerase